MEISYDLSILLKQPVMAVTIVATLIALVFAYFKLKGNNVNLPPGSCGLPLLIGESISFARAMTVNKTAEWIRDRADRHGPAFKTSLFGLKTVVLIGRDGNRFIFGGADGALASNQPMTMAMIFGKHSIFEMSGEKHRLVRAAVVAFLKPESIRRYLGTMESVVQAKISEELDGKNSVHVVPLMKSITFNVAADIFFGLPDGEERETLLEDFKTAIQGAWTVPLDFPGTVFHRALKARERMCQKLSRIIGTRRTQKEEGRPRDDVITSLLLILDENGGPCLSEVEILDVSISLIMASYDTITVVLALFVRLLARDSELFERVLKEQREVCNAKREGSKGGGGGSGSGDEGKLGWNDVQMMKYSWRVAQEILRLYQPIFGNFRRVVRDVKFGSYDIPKGWQIFWVSSGTHLDHNIFENPQKFDPSRFESSTQSYPPYSYVPFGGGPRICPGVEFARVEILLVIHHMVTKYRWKEKIPDEPITRRPVPLPAMGLPIILEPINLNNANFKDPK